MSYGKIFHGKREGNIEIVTLNVPDQPVNTWTQAAIEELKALLDDLEKGTDAKGVVFISGKEGNFHAGADLNLLNRMKERKTTVEALDLYHGLFKRLEGLPIPSLAAIEGHCFGGGLEFTLACTARIAKASKGTLLGLPECTLGIFPGAGGTQRLPRLIGYGAIPLILKGEVYPASKAFDLGVVDRLVVPEGDLRREAVAFMKEILSDRTILKRKTHDFSQIAEVTEEAWKEVLKATRGREIPGPMLALQSIREGLKVPLEQGLEIEKNNFVEAVLSNQAKGSIHTFFLKTLSDKPGVMMSEGFEPGKLNRVAVLGFGAMGRGIVIDVLRNTQIPIVVKDVPASLEPGKTFVRKILEGMAEKKKLKSAVDDLMSRLTVTADYGEGLAEADLVIEAVYEDIKVKATVYEEICRVVKEDCILASNTSSIPLQAMSRHIASPERFAGLHFFSPVWLMQLVEVIRGERTSRETIDHLLSFTAAIRKRPIVCKDNPGFVVNAVLFPYFMDALAFLEEGTPIEKVDGAFVHFGMPLGPIKLIDEVGIDVSHYVVKGKGLEQETLRNMVKAGRLGLKKSGKGFYLADGSVDREALSLVASKGGREKTAEEMQRKVLTDMITVGKELLDKGIVDDPRMIDIGMIWGTGFPPDRGGPMKWADLIGRSQELFGKPFYPEA